MVEIPITASLLRHQLGKQHPQVGTDAVRDQVKQTKPRGTKPESVMRERSQRETRDEVKTGAMVKRGAMPTAVTEVQQMEHHREESQ